MFSTITTVTTLDHLQFLAPHYPIHVERIELLCTAKTFARIVFSPCILRMNIRWKSKHLIKYTYLKHAISFPFEKPAGANGEKHKKTHKHSPRISSEYFLYKIHLINTIKKVNVYMAH